jgi:integration host factor subunit alpha
MKYKNITRKELSNQIYKKIGFSKRLSLKIIDDIFESIVDEIIKSKKVKISSFGTFSTLNKRERIGRNPKTKIEVKIKPRKVVKFKPSLSVNKIINNNE